MAKILPSLLPKEWRPGLAATAGLLATAAYSVAMENDKYLTGNRFNDVEFIQGLFGNRDASSKRFRTLAWGLHFLNGAMLGEVYAALCKRLLPGPNWLRGALFGGVFITLAWPLTPLADRFHPMIKNGQLPPLANWPLFWQNLLRHVLFGLVLGLIYREK